MHRILSYTFKCINFWTAKMYRNDGMFYEIQNIETIVLKRFYNYLLVIHTHVHMLLAVKDYKNKR